MAGRITCGVAGWSYPDWVGYVYPHGLRNPLDYLAGYVDLIEINSSFYRSPSPVHAARWARIAAAHPGFAFTAKLHKSFTHDGQVPQAAIDEFKRGMNPLAEAGVLRHLLAQFRYDFADTPRNRELLQKIHIAFSGMANVSLELRHRTWQATDALAFFTRLGATLVNLDYPLGHDSFDLQVTGIGRQAYLRLHGRNRAAWFDHEAGRDETYNYLYQPGEMEELARRAKKIVQQAESLVVVANNHYQGKAVVNALQFKAMLEGAPVKVPEPLLGRYPALASIADVTGSGLLPLGICRALPTAKTTDSNSMTPDPGAEATKDVQAR